MGSSKKILKRWEMEWNLLKRWEGLLASLGEIMRVGL